MSSVQENLVAPEPEHCPGTQSQDAGKASACEGCPNQQICASGVPQAPDPDIQTIAEKLKSVKHKILILSGKGGVGKSTLTAMLARALAVDSDVNVGVLDIDLCGPSAPRIFGVLNEQVSTEFDNHSRKSEKENYFRLGTSIRLRLESRRRRRSRQFGCHVRRVPLAFGGRGPDLERSQKEWPD